MTNEFILFLFQVIVFIFSVMIHEVSHGLVAYRLGDDTAKQMNRLNLNPVNHLDPFGSFFLPLLLILSGSPIIFGWAKPVPYNPHNLKNPKSGAALIGAAGPLSNIAIAVIFGILIRLSGEFLSVALPPLLLLLNIVVFINILLAVFNLVPIPPLDGSKVFFALLPAKYYRLQKMLEDYGLFILLFFLLIGLGLIIPIIQGLHALLVGPWLTLWD